MIYLSLRDCPTGLSSEKDVLTPFSRSGVHCGFFAGFGVFSLATKY